MQVQMDLLPIGQIATMYRFAHPACPGGITGDIG